MDGHSLVRLYPCVITKFSRLDELTIFITHGASLARFARGSSTIKTTDEPFCTLLTGGAGVGKSHVTKALYQAVIKYLNVRVGDDFNKVKAILLALTGKAAYNIQGKTIHSTLNIPANQISRTIYISLLTQAG